MRIDFNQVNDLKELFWYSILSTDNEYASVLCLNHYTNAENKSHIVKDDFLDIRLTRADNFLDKDEGEHIINVFRYTIKKCVRCKKIDSAYSSALLSVINDYQLIVNKLKEKYIFCFSKNCYNTYLRENYACKNGKNGIIIEFNALDIEMLDEIKCNGKLQISLVDVLYDKIKLSKYMEELICRMYHLRSQDDEDLTIAKKIAYRQLIIYSLAYKKSEYALEEETRLIVSCSDDVESDRIYFDSDKNYLHILLDKTALYHVTEVTQ